MIEGAENLKFVYMAGLAFKDSYDAWGAGEKSQLLYEVTGCAGGERVFLQTIRIIAPMFNIQISVFIAQTFLAVLDCVKKLLHF